jgi:ethanolamine ammonia-lyase small subunit
MNDADAAVPSPRAGGDPWPALRLHTPARIALARSGSSLGTADTLAFELAHAQARDAVRTPLDVPALRAALEAEAWPVLEVRSQAAHRDAYLARPDWGRRLHAESRALLAAARHEPTPTLAIVLADGLSSKAVQAHAVPMLHALRETLPEGCRSGPIVIATQARVALADEVGELLGARLALILIGERPGLSSPDSLGAYLTYAPRVGRNDAERNCISNIRPQGLSFEHAAGQLAALISATLREGVSGVALRFDASRVLPAE